VPIGDASLLTKGVPVLARRNVGAEPPLSKADNCWRGK
jgi:hypothetical protein